MALYPKAVKRLIPPGSTDPRIKADCLVLHVAATEAMSLYGYFNGNSGGVESHFYIRYDGVVEQYRDTDYQADAQMASARNEISVETQGLARGKWTAAQIAALVDLARWCHAEHGMPLELNRSESSPRGIAYHSQYPSWSGDGRTCPGVDRIPQIHSEILPALLEEDDMANVTDAEKKQLLDAAALIRGLIRERYYVLENGVLRLAAKDEAGAQKAFLLDTIDGNTLSGRIADAALDAAELAAVVKAAVPTLEKPDVDAIVDAFAARLAKPQE